MLKLPLQLLSLGKIKRRLVCAAPDPSLGLTSLVQRKSMASTFGTRSTAGAASDWIIFINLAMGFKVWGWNSIKHYSLTLLDNESMH